MTIENKNVQAVEFDVYYDGNNELICKVEDNEFDIDDFEDWASDKVGVFLVIDDLDDKVDIISELLKQLGIDKLEESDESIFMFNDEIQALIMDSKEYNEYFA